MKNNQTRTPLQKAFRMMTIVFLLTTLPFVVVVFEKKFGANRMVASDGSSENISATAENDLSEASPEEFRKAFKYQILKNASIDHTSEGPGLSVGIFLLKDASGQKIFACDKYRTVDFIFAADGVAFSGEIPHMIVRGPCLVNSDQQHIETLPIPFSRILKSPVTQTEFQAEVPGSQQPFKIFFRNVVEFWPTEWSWVGMVLYGDTQDEKLSINGYEVISVIGEPVIIKAAKPTE